MGIYNGLLSWQPVFARSNWTPQPETRFTLPVGSRGVESSVSPSGSTGPNYSTNVGPSWQAPADFVITAVRVEVTGALASNSCRLGLTEMGSDDQPLVLAGDFGTVDCSTTGFKDIANLQCRVYAGRWYASLLTRFGGGGSISVRAWATSYGHFGDDLTTTNRVLQTRTNSTAQTTSTAGYPYRPLPWTTVASGAANNLAGPVDWMFMRREPITR